MSTPGRQGFWGGASPRQDPAQPWEAPQQDAAETGRSGSCPAPAERPVESRPPPLPSEPRPSAHWYPSSTASRAVAAECASQPFRPSALLPKYLSTAPPRHSPPAPLTRLSDRGRPALPPGAPEPLASSSRKCRAVWGRRETGRVFPEARNTGVPG